MNKSQVQSGLQDVYTALNSSDYNETDFTQDILNALEKYNDIIRASLKNKYSGVELSNRVDKSINKYLEKAIQIINTNRPIEIIDSSLFLPGNMELKGISSKKKQFEVKTIDKYDQFITQYNDLFLGDNNTLMNIFQEKLDKNKMRAIPYKIIHFTSNDRKLTFLISDEIGQATFIYLNHVKPDKFSLIHKGDTLEGNYPEKLIYSDNYREKLNYILSNRNDTLEQNIFENSEITRDNVRDYLLESSNSLNKPLLEFTQFDIKEIEINGKKINSLISSCEIKITGNPQNSYGYEEFLKKLFGLEWYNEEKLRVKKRIQKELLQIATDKNISLLEFSIINIREIDINGNKIRSLVGLCDIQITGNSQNLSGFYEFLKKLFGKEWSKKEVKKNQKNKEGKILEQVRNTREKLLKVATDENKSLLEFTALDIEGISINENKIDSLINLCDIQITGNPHTIFGFNKFLKELLG